MIQQVLSSSTNQKTRHFFHHIRGTAGPDKEILVITGYDYFLHKYDLRQLRRRYHELILVPREVENQSLINQTIRPLPGSSSRIHLVINPEYDQQHQVVYQLVVRQRKFIRVSTVHDFCEQSLRKQYIPAAADEAALTRTLLPFGWGVRLFKKGLDLISVFLLLVISWPVWLLSAYRIRRQSPGPVFYRQSRLGCREVEFQCIKFRSMRLDAEAEGPLSTNRNDKRVFPYGALMRSARIDELPQLLNILKGQVSLIGPRPERRVFTDTFEECIPHYAIRHLVKPGITGYAQIRYPYGTGIHDARHKLMYDLYYIKHWSIGLELRIAAETVVTIAKKKGW